MIVIDSNKLKKIIPIIIILSLIGFKIYADKLDKRQEEIAKNNIPVEDYDIDAMHEGIGDGVKEDYQSGYEVLNLDKCFEFLDPYETYRYNDLLLLYSNYIIVIADSESDSKTFFNENKEMLKKVMGIYEIRDLEILRKEISKSKIDRKSKLKDISIKSIVQEGNLLKVKLDIVYSNSEITIEHYINYVYIEKNSSLFIYDIN